MFNIYFKEMKKFFSLIALVGIIAACTPEQIQTAFKLAGASGKITVEVVKINGEAYSGTFQISGQESLAGQQTTYSGNKAEITFQFADSQAIENVINLTLTATGDGILKPASAPVIVPKVLAGGVVELACKIVVGENADGWYVYTSTDYDDDYFINGVGYLVNSHYGTYTHSSSVDFGPFEVPVESWYVNESDLILSGVAEVEVIDGYPEGEGIDYGIIGFENTVAEFIDAYTYEALDNYTVEVPFQVSGWAMWNFVTVYYGTHYYTSLIANKLDADGDLTDEEVLLAEVAWDTVGTVGTPVELPYPGMPGDAHYEEGHGHGHGGDNAGGGIAINE